MQIIAVNGFKRSGKGTVANMIEEHVLVGQVKQVGFADKVKIFGARALGFLDRTDEELIELMDIAKEHWLIDIAREGTEGPFFPRMNVGAITGRQFLQNVGTEARKIFGDDFWVDQVLPPRPVWDDPVGIPNDLALNEMHPRIDWLLITDLRFENEAQRVLDLGGEIWTVSRPGIESDGHASEQPLPDRYITRRLDNSGTLDDLRLEVQESLHYMEESIY